MHDTAANKNYVCRIDASSCHRRAHIRSQTVSARNFSKLHESASIAIVPRARSARNGLLAPRDSSPELL